MILVEALHLAATAADTALLWLTQALIYPQFLQVPPDAFPEYHRQHMRRMMAPVGVIYLTEGVSAALLTWWLLGDTPVVALLAALLFLAQVGLTFFWFVPHHQDLAQQADPAKLHTALTMNRWRVGLESMRLALALGWMS